MEEQLPNNLPTKATEKSTFSKKKFLTPLIIALNSLILLFVILGVAYFFFFFHKNQPEQKNKNSQQATISATENKEEEKREVIYVSAQEGLNLREQPTTNSVVLLMLPYATELKIIGTEGDWYYVEAQTKGYVAKEFTTNEKPNIYLRLFSDQDSPFSFLYHSVYKVNFSKKENTYEYSFTGNDSFGGFKVEIEENLATIGNYALQKYPNGKKTACDISFGSGRKECEKIEEESGIIYLVLVNNRLYKFTYLKTEGGLLEDIKNIVFYSLYFK